MTDVKSCQRYISHKVQPRLFDWMGRRTVLPFRLLKGLQEREIDFVVQLTI